MSVIIRKNGASGAGMNRWKSVAWPVAVLLALLVGLGLFLALRRPEPLAPKEMLAKNDWNEAELGRALGRSMSPHFDRSQRVNVQRHLYGQMRKLPPAARSRVNTEGIRYAVDETLAQLRSVPAADRSVMRRKLHERALDNYMTVVNLPAARREEMRRFVESDEGRAVGNEFFSAVYGKLTPDERGELGPTIKIWLRTMDELGK